MRKVNWGWLVNRWRRKVRRYFQPEHVELGLGLIYYESRGKRRAANPDSDARGLFQHRLKYWSWRSYRAGCQGMSIFNGEANIRTAAWLLYDGDTPQLAPNWSHWAATYPQALATVQRGHL